MIPTPCLHRMLLAGLALAAAAPATATCNSALPRETPDAAFAVGAGGHVVTHAATGLSWRRCQLGMAWDGVTCSGIGQALTWQQALQAVEDINAVGFAGQDDWRLPDLAELLTLVDHACVEPAINANLFPNTAFPTPDSDYFWTATPDGSAGRAWAVRFRQGRVTDYGMGQTLRVRPVRGRLSGAPGAGPPSGPSAAFVDHFDDYDATLAKGWLVGNASEPEGEGTWTWGNDALFPAQAGASSSQLGVGYLSTGDNGTISNWLLTPLLDFRPGSTVSFWTRTVAGAAFPDRLQVRVCLGEPCNLVGPGAFGVTGFESLLLDINPLLLAGPDPTGASGYPDQWARFFLDAGDGVPQSGRGRIAFRYFVEDAGLLGSNSDYIGIDSVRIEAAPLSP